jgi:DNA topoisomerase IA
MQSQPNQDSTYLLMACPCLVKLTAYAHRQAIVSEHTNDGRWGAHAAAILAGTMWKPPRAGGHDDKAHPPIHPTKYSAGENDWSHGEALVG